MADMGAEWNLATLREYFLALMLETEKRNEQRFAAQEKAVAAALQAAKEAVLKAEVAAERRFESVNEFRGQLSDQTRTFIPRLEAEARLDQLSIRMTKLETKAERQEGKVGGVSGLWAAIIAAASIIVAIAAVALSSGTP